MHTTYTNYSSFSRVTLYIKSGSKRLVIPLVWYPCGEPYKQNKQYHHAKENSDTNNLLKGNKKVPAGVYVSNIPLVIIIRNLKSTFNLS